MHRPRHLLLVLGAAVCSHVCLAAEPKLNSIHPIVGMRGEPFSMTVRGTAIKDATAVFADGSPLRFSIEGTDVDPSKGKNAADLVRLRVEAPADTPPGAYTFRLVTPGGVSNALPIRVTAIPVPAETEGSHETPATAIPVTAPAIRSGRILRRGEFDLYAIEAKAGETFTFEAISGLPAPGAAGGNANGFDPSITILEPAGSWFDSTRLKRLAFNDEPLWVLGDRTDAHFPYTFARAGLYYIRVEAFSGQGGPDYSYEFKVTSGAAKQDPPPPSPKQWSERSYSRRLSADRLNELAARGAAKQDHKSIETYGPSNFKFPGTLTGAIAKPGDSQRASFKIEGPQDIAIEIETPRAKPPLFNPIVRLLDASGEEVATSIFVGRGACTGAMNKSTQSKTIIPLRNPGEYTIEVRDTTADYGAPDFEYRVQVRPQVPHLGQIKIDDDKLNLTPGDAKTVRVTFDREEDFRGAVAVNVTGLPAGITALAGADYEPDKDPPSPLGKRERYVPRTERSVIVFSVDADAKPTTTPQIAEITVRPIAGGKPGPVAMTKKIPIMVVSK